jgi:hypothetical protein
MVLLIGITNTKASVEAAQRKRTKIPGQLSVTVGEQNN